LVICLIMRTRFFISGVFLVVSLALAGCATKVQLVNTPLVPAADGEVRISTDDNNNTKVKLEVKHLAPPSSLTPPQSMYVVWTRADGDQPRNEGMLQIGDNREGKIEFVTPAEQFELLVTAEESVDVRFPSNMVALRADVSR
jgi:hypothetical protein